MPSKKAKSAPSTPIDPVQPIAVFDTSAPLAGIPGPGRWLVAEYEPTALFSLKISSATSTVAKTLIVPTPYAIKMALVDSGFRAGLSDDECADLLRALVGLDVRISPPANTVVTHTFIKVRQESRDPDPLLPYSSTVSYREFVYHSGCWKWAFDLAGANEILAGCLVNLLPHISYIGKRGSFIAFRRMLRVTALGADFTQPVQTTGAWSPPPRAHIAPLDDFGPDADMATLSSYSKGKPKRDRHRKFVETIIPLGMVNTGPGFTEYDND